MRGLTLLATFALLATATLASRHVLWSVDPATKFPLHTEVDSVNAKRLPFVVHLAHQNLDKLDEAFEAVSNPDSAQYRQFWAEHDLENLVAASPETVFTVRAWLEQHEVEIISNKGNALQCVGSADNIERAFATKLVYLSDGVEPIRLTFKGDLSVPVELKPHVDIVTGLTHVRKFKASSKASQNGDLHPIMAAVLGSIPEFGVGSSAQDVVNNTVSSTVPTAELQCPAKDAPQHTLSCFGSDGNATACCPGNSQCCASPYGGTSCCVGGTVCCQGKCKKSCGNDPTDIYMTPDTLRTQYNIPKGFQANGGQVAQAVVAFGDQYSPGAKDLFVRSFGQKQFNVHSVYHGGDGCINEGCDQGESDLDIQYMSSMGAGVDQWFWWNSGEDYTLKWAMSVLAAPKPKPLVHSISYIVAEKDYPVSYLEQSDVKMQMMGTAGHSIMACAGDTGNPGWANNFPLDYTGRNFPQPCANCPTFVNKCNQLQYIWQPKDKSQNTATCNLPTGLTSRDPSDNAACLAALQTNACKELQAKVQTALAQANKCNLQVVKQDCPAQHLVNGTCARPQIRRIFSENCECSDVTKQLQADGVDSVTNANGTCTIKGWEYSAKGGPSFTPLYPASSQFVTAVAATRVTSRGAAPLCLQKIADFDGFDREIQCSPTDVVSSLADQALITSGGGFSTYGKQAGHQQEAVKQYINKLMHADALPPSDTFTWTKRAYPDVAISGHNYLIALSTANVTAGENALTCPCVFSPVDGTSCASPAFAGIVGALNNQLVAAGQAPLGPINPLLYKMARERPATFTDVRVGDSKCTESVCSQWGFSAQDGWDATSGLGVPNVQEIRDYLFQDAIAVKRDQLSAKSRSLQSQVDDHSTLLSVLAGILGTTIVAIIIFSVIVVCRRRQQSSDYLLQ